MESTTDQLQEQARQLAVMQVAVARALGMTIEFLDAHPEFDAEEQKVMGCTNRRGIWCRIVFELTLGIAREFLRFSLGLIKPEKSAKYRALSGEKWKRLAERTDDFSSHQSRDPTARLGIEPGDERWGCWGGATRASNYIFSISGLSEHADEVVAVIAQILCFVMKQEDAVTIFRASENILGFTVLESDAFKSAIAAR